MTNKLREVSEVVEEVVPPNPYNKKDPEEKQSWLIYSAIALNVKVALEKTLTTDREAVARAERERKSPSCHTPETSAMCEDCQSRNAYNAALNTIKQHIKEVIK